jgi:hypothetical protein
MGIDLPKDVKRITFRGSGVKGSFFAGRPGGFKAGKLKSVRAR